MSNVRIEATGEVGLTVEIVLGANIRDTHEVNAGEAVDLTVGGSQKLVVNESATAAPTAKASDASQDVPVGVDVTDQAPADTEEGGGNILANLGGALFGDDKKDFDPEG